ncbi:MAG: hypothetical protein HYT76_04630 [Deltaproteobacteria bacterium]|nr:hypothetical protein [Deltaproteobacteria bacterium]
MTLTRCVIAFFIFFSTSVAANTPVKEQIELTRNGTEILLKRNYPEARKFIYKLLEKEETRLLGYFGIMAYTQIRNLENYDYRFDSEYLVLAEGGRKKALDVYKDPKSSGWDLLVAGGILGVSGFYKAHHGKWLASLWDGQTALRAMKIAYQRDTTLTDALLGIGFYHYWMSHFTRRLKLLPFVADRRNLGKRQIRMAGELGQVVGPLAEISLGFIDYVEKDYPKALVVTKKMLSSYPDNIVVRMLQGQTYFKMRDYQRAREEFKRILAIDSSLTKGWLFLGLIEAYEGKNPKEARRLLQLYLDLDKTATTHWKKLAEEALARLRSVK